MMEIRLSIDNNTKTYYAEIDKTFNLLAYNNTKTYYSEIYYKKYIVEITDELMYSLNKHKEYILVVNDDELEIALKDTDYYWKVEYNE